MASKNSKLRETMRNRLLPARGEDGEDEIEWRPDWARPCDVCGQTPAMVGVSGGVVVVEATLCAQCLDAGEAPRVAVCIGY